MKRWPEISIRFFGALQWLLCAVGLWFLFQTVFTFTVRREFFGDNPFQARIFYARSVINLVFIALLIWAGYLLLKLERRGVIATNWTLISEFGYFLLTIAVGLAFGLSGRENLELIGNAMGATAGIGDMGIAPHFVSGYPILALLVLNLARWKLDRSAGWRPRKTLSTVTTRTTPA